MALDSLSFPFRRRGDWAGDFAHDPYGQEAKIGSIRQRHGGDRV